MRLAALSSALSLVLVASGAAAAGPELGAPEWTGVYLGGSIGLDRNDVDWDIDTGASVTQFAHLGSTNVNAGLFAGYNYEFAPRTVAGLEVGAEFLTGKAEEHPRADPALTDNFIFTAGARLGELLTPRTLLYGKLSYAGMNVSAPVERWAAAADSAWLGGYQAAIGMESEVSPAFRLRAEVAFTQAVDHLHLQTTFDEFTPEFLSFRLGAIYAFDEKRKDAAAAQTESADVGSWTGFYVGGHGGGAAGGTDFGHFDSPSDGPFSDIAANWGAWAGYDFQLSPHWVVGVEGDFTNLGLASRLIGDTVDFAKTDWMASATLRAGYLADPATLLYVKGGWATIHAEGTKDVLLVDADSGDLNGEQVGLGIETKLNRHFSIRVEGLYTAALENLWFNRSIPAPGVSKADFISPTLITGQIGASVHF